MNSSFASHIESLVEDFLETALVVDDEGLPPGPPTAATDEGEPVAVRTREDLSLRPPTEGEVLALEAQHPLASKELTDAFADLGIACGVLAPLKDDKLIRDRLLRVAARADLVVLDWDLHRDKGATALELMKALLDQDASAERRRLRIIAVYTGQTGLPSIMQRIRKGLDVSEDHVSRDGLTLTTENVRIVAYSKVLGATGRTNPPTREVAEKDLPARLVAEFSALSCGLVPGVALAALAAVRNETHRMLHALRAEMDLGYLGHRVASSFPPDTEQHLVDVVAAELASILTDGAVGGKADIGVIREWLDQEYANTPPLNCGSALDPEKTVGRDDLERMLTVGLGRDEALTGYSGEGMSKTALKRIRRQAAQLFTNSAGNAETSSNVFAIRMALRTLYQRPTRLLQLGTIVLHRSEFLVCVQPRCDSIRIDPGTARGFPFLPFEPAVPGGRHDYVVEHPDGSGALRLRLHTKPFALRTYDFEPDENGSVSARLVTGRWKFSGRGNRSFEWVADLKPDFAHRVAVDLAAELARVGLDESELVRVSEDPNR